MKNLFLILLVLNFALPAVAAPAMRWECSGTDIANDAPVTFELVFADHDREKYTYLALERFVYDGKKAEDFDLNQTSVVCGKDDDGNDRIGSQTWGFEGDQFHFHSGCENEALEIQATCASK